jgi:hypothetical protein
MAWASFAGPLIARQLMTFRRFGGLLKDIPLFKMLDIVWCNNALFHSKAARANRPAFVPLPAGEDFHLL